MLINSNSQILIEYHFSVEIAFAIFTPHFTFRCKIVSIAYLDIRKFHLKGLYTSLHVKILSYNFRNVMCQFNDLVQ